MKNPMADFLQGMILNLIADYKLPDGSYAHMAFQALCPYEEKQHALDAVLEQIREKGYRPISVAYVPGHYSLPQLEKITAFGNFKAFQVLWIDPAMFHELRTKE